MATVAIKPKTRIKDTAPERRSDSGRRQVDQLYQAFRRDDAKLISPDGNFRLLPESLNLFLEDLIAQLGSRKAVTIARNEATLTTLEAANILDVSRQFLVNLLEKGEIAFHMVGTHRRVYTQDLFVYKAKRDKGRREILRDLAAAEVEEGLYGRIPITTDAP